ncbi:MAG: nucleotide exchange factor GrpE [Actinomycetota bacterium]
MSEVGSVEEVPTEKLESVGKVEDGLVQDAETQLGILTSDLQRLQAEYSNYRKRVERDRALAHELAVASVLSELLSIFDDLDRAKAHDELQGGFKSVADQLSNVASKLGLEQFGEAGSAFDPQIHEALMHSTSPDVKRPTATAILQSGYRYKNRILRPARVAVTDPE